LTALGLAFVTGAALALRLHFAFDPALALAVFDVFLGDGHTEFGWRTAPCHAAASNAANLSAAVPLPPATIGAGMAHALAGGAVTPAMYDTTGLGHCL